MSKELGYAIDLKVEDMAFSTSHLDMLISVNDALKIEVEGFYAPWDKRVDVAYHLFGEKIAYRDIAFVDHVDMRGDFKGWIDLFHINGKGKALEGAVDFSLTHRAKNEQDIQMHADKISSAKLRLLFGQKPLFAGKLSIDADVPIWSDFKKQGTIHVVLERGGVYLQEIKRLYGIRFPDDFMIQATGDIHLSDAKHTIAGQIVSTIGDIHFRKGRFIETNQKLNILYDLDIPELSKWLFITRKKYVGAFHASGEIEYQNALRFDGVSHSVGGEINYYYEKQNLEAGLVDVSLEKMLSMLHYPPIMIGKISGKVAYDLKENIALINVQSNKLHFKQNPMTQKIFRLSGVDFAKEIFTRSYFSASVDDGIVSYDFKAKNAKSYLNLLNTKMDAKKNTIHSHFDLKMQNEELSGEIYGSLKSPQVKLDVGKYIEFKAKKEIDGFFGAGTTKKVKEKLKDVDVEDVKGFIKGLF